MEWNECIEYTTNVVSHLSNLPEQKKRRFLKSIEKVHKRADSPYLHVALIGDFSTGKSTFINALVQKNILKTAWQATTAVPTLIYYHKQETVQVIVETAGRERFVLDDSGQRRQLEQRLRIQLPEETTDMIAFLSTNNDFAGKIKHVEIRVPSFEELQHICIIDTPGVNPGAKEAKSHVLRTQNVLTAYADATIVLFQETQVFSGSFKKFLEENAEHFMNDAIFIITMMDLAEEGEREVLMDYVRNQLRQTFGLEHPLVFGCCAKAAVSGKIDRESLYWAGLFDDLRREMIRYMASRRKQVINQQMTSLLESLICELDAEVASNLSVIEQKKKKLEENMAANQRSQLEREYLFTKEKLDIQRRRHEEMHTRLEEYLYKLKQERCVDG